MAKKKTRRYPECGKQPSLSCLERGISKDIRAAKGCKQVKRLDRRARFLVSLGRFGKLPFGATEAKQAAKRLHRQVCEKQARTCRKPTKSCRI